MGSLHLSVTYLEVIWTLVGVLCSTINVVILTLAIRDVMAIYATKTNGAKRIEGWTGVIVHSLFVVSQVIGVIVGVVVLASPPSNPDQPITTYARTLSLSLTGKELIIAALGLIILWRRAKLETYLDVEREKYKEAGC